MSTHHSIPSQPLARPSTEPSSQLYSNVEYTALEPRRREIRLMTLLPGQAHEDIKASLSIVLLDSDPQYEALSYVWGDQNIPRTILLNGRILRVTVNLEAALRRLRHTHAERIFWIDAICVNQQDLAERESQVSLMASIYTGCQLCTVWLGEEDPTTEQALELIRSMASGDHFNLWACFSSEFRASLVAHSGSRMDLQLLFHRSKSIFEPFDDFFEKPWWSRTWTVQEIALPKRAVLKCGRYEIDWNTILLAFKSVERHLYTCCLPFYDSLMTEDYNSLKTLIHAVSSLSLDYNVGYNLVSILMANRQRQASDCRDKAMSQVYGFLSLCSKNVQDKFGADYSASLLDCFAWPVINDIQDSGNLRSLGLALNAEKNLQLPSWVTDWSDLTAELSLGLVSHRLNMYELFEASRGTAVSFSRQSHLLSLWGLHWKTIAIVGAAESDRSDRMDVLRSWSELWKLNRCKDRFESGGNEESMVPFLITLMFDSFQSYKQSEDHLSGYLPASRAVSTDLEVCERWWTLACEKHTPYPHSEMEPGAEASLMNSISSSISSCIFYRRFFITGGGYIGMGPSNTKVGDKIWIMCGGKMPLILRPDSQNSSPGGPACYKLVGDCYVDGIMDGEAAEHLMRDRVEVQIS